HAVAHCALFSSLLRPAYLQWQIPCLVRRLHRTVSRTGHRLERNPSRLAAALDAAHNVRLSAVIHGADGNSVSPHLGLSVPARAMGGRDIRARSLSACARLYILLHPRDWTQPGRLAFGRTHIWLRRLDGARVYSQRAVAECHDVDSAFADRHR